MSLKPLETKNPLERALKRERAARKHAEKLLESRSLELYNSTKALEDAYLSTIEVFASLVGGRSGRKPDSLRRLGRNAKAVAKILGLDAAQRQDIYLAGTLCDMGKLVLADELTNKAVIELSKSERLVFQTHPQLTYEALITLGPLDSVANTILQHCELFDGSGYPNGLQGEAISISARILCVVKDFDALLRGVLLPSELTESEAIQYLVTNKGKRYDPAVVEAFKVYLESSKKHDEKLAEERLTPNSLREGMVLTRDLLNDQEVLVLSAGRILDPSTIGKLRRISNARDVDIIVFVEPADKIEKTSENSLV